MSFNPFEAGRGFSTYVGWAMCRKQACFNPFGAGRGQQNPELSKMLDNVALHKDMQAKGISTESLKSGVI